MDVGTLVNAVVVATVGLILGWLGKGQFEAVDRRLDRMEGRLDQRIDHLEQRMDGFQASLDSMRSDLTQVALAVGVRPRATNA
jgi:hypothetical protein